ncbi:hypothetical protein JHK85_040893 [Glycine max]|nr:hypothetical protein JHK86_040309 [Glycine max]KAG4965918.1 hypothetical protein JHK85_040893 [Glycine max]
MKPLIIYEDLKCSNILLGEGYHSKLSDFGLAKLPSWGGDQYQKTMGVVPEDTSWINEKVKSTPPADSDTPKKRARKSSGSKKDNKETEYASEEGKAKSETEDPKAAEEEEDNEGNNDSRGKQLENGDKTEQI